MLLELYYFEPVKLESTFLCNSRVPLNRKKSTSVGTKIYLSLISFCDMYSATKKGPIRAALLETETT